MLKGRNSVVRGRIWPIFELICTLMVVLITCKIEEDPIKNEGARVLTTFLLLVYGDFSRCSRAGNSVVLGSIWPNLELVRDIMVVLVTSRMKKIQSKMKVLECSQH